MKIYIYYGVVLEYMAEAPNPDVKKMTTIKELVEEVAERLKPVV